MHKLGDLKGVDALSDIEVATALTQVVHIQNQASADKYALLEQFARRGLNLRAGHSSASHYLAAGTRVALGNASRQIDTAAWLTRHPTVLEALSNSDIHDAHVKEIYDGHDTIRKSDPTLTEERLGVAVADLLATAIESTAGQVKHRAQVLGHAAADDVRARYEQALRRQRERAEREAAERAEQAAEEQGQPVPDTDEDDDDDEELLVKPPPVPVSENAALNTFDLYLQSNGRTTIRGDVDTVLAQKLHASLSPFSKPQPAPDGTRDPRSASKRRADALSQLLDQRSVEGHSAGLGRPPATVNVTVNLRDLLADRFSASDGPDPGVTHPSGGEASKSAPSMGDPDWPFNLEWTGPISHSLARLLACDADLHPIVLDNNDVPLSMGGRVRLATPGQRAAVTVRDKCCIRCGMPARWCQVHHIVFWEDGGPTDLTNLVLLCGDCHRLVHNHGWGVKFGDDGHPCVIPPATIDPERKPIPSFHRQRRPAA